MNGKQLSRRDFLRALGLGSAALLTGNGLASLLSGCTSQGEASIVAGDTLLSTTGTPIPATGSASGTEPDIEIALRAVPAEVPILPGTLTRVWQYQG